MPRDNDRKELADKTHADFEISCKKCGSHVVIVESDVGFSETSGAWGGVKLVCCDCRNYTEIWEV